jgi:hypothetical protein
MAGELQATFRDERVAKTLVETQSMALRLEGPDGFRAFYADQMKTWGDVVRENQIKPD